MMKLLMMVVLPGMIAVLFSLNIAVAAPSNMLRQGGWPR